MMLAPPMHGTGWRARVSWAVTADHRPQIKFDLLSEVGPRQPEAVRCVVQFPDGESRVETLDRLNIEAWWLGADFTCGNGTAFRGVVKPPAGLYRVCWFELIDGAWRIVASVTEYITLPFPSR